jgi:hypothetical protein
LVLELGVLRCGFDVSLSASGTLCHKRSRSVGVNDSGENGGSGAVSETPNRSRRRRTLVIAVAGVLLVVAITGVAIAATSSKTPSAGAAVIVRKALVSTLATNSVAFTLSESVSAADTTVAVNGSGECNLSSALCGVTLNYSGLLASAGTIRTVYSGGSVYLNLGDALSGLASTPWISIPVNTSSSASLGISQNPLSGLSLLASEGAAVTNDGSVSENGQTMTQYTVTIDGSQAQHLVTSATAKLPSWMAAAASKDTIGTIVETVDIDSAGRLGYVSANVSSTVAGTTVNVTSAETITGYGLPVDVTVPPASQVTSITSLSQLTGL